MALTLQFLCCFISFLFFIEIGKCERLRDQMYFDLPGTFCFRRLTATKQHGCTSSSSGDSGVVHFVTSADDIDWIVKSGPADPYVPVLSLDFATRNNMIRLRDSGKVSGIVLWRNKTLDSFSTDDTCPNRYTGMASEECAPADVWNPAGNSLLFEDWGFPVVYTKQSDLMENVTQCFQKYNNFDLDGQKDRTLCAIRIDSYMSAAVDSQTCIRRNSLSSNLAIMKYCDPLGDFNIIMMAKPAATNTERSVLMLTARLDGASMFDMLAPGAMDPVTSVVTLLTICSYLRDMGAFNKTSEQAKNAPTQCCDVTQCLAYDVTARCRIVFGLLWEFIKIEKNLMVVLLNGESFDYIGSSRIVYDMKQKRFPSPELPLSFNEIGLILELNQLTGKQLYYHTHSNSTAIVKQFTSKFEENLVKFDSKLSRSDGKLPPSSMQRFLLADPEIPTVLLSNYNASYNNPFYHSIADDADFLAYKYGNGSVPTSQIQQEISQIALAIAKSIYSLLFKADYNESVNLKVSLVDELLHCYLESQNCTLFQNVSNSLDLQNDASPLYVGVSGHNNTVTQLTGRTLAYLTGNVKPGNESVCANYTSPGMSYIRMTNSCIETSMQYYIADSPAFEIDGYNWTSNQYSTWTESVWHDLQMRMFVKPSAKHEILNVSIGLCVLILSFVIVFFINSTADVLFNRRDGTLSSGDL